MVTVLSALPVFLLACTLTVACGMHDPLPTAGGLLQYIVSFPILIFFVVHCSLSAYLKVESWVFVIESGKLKSLSNILQLLLQKAGNKETPCLLFPNKNRVLFPKRKDKALFNLCSLILGCLENIREEQGVFLSFLALL